MKFEDIFNDNAKDIIESKYKWTATPFGFYRKTPPVYSNNWRKLHGLPMIRRRKLLSTLIIKVIRDEIVSEFHSEIERAEQDPPLKMKFNVISCGEMGIPLS